MRKEKLEELKSFLEEIKIIKKDEKENGSFLRSVPYEIVLNNGRVFRREKLLKNGIDGSAVVIVPHIKELDEYLVVIEPRVFTRDGFGVGFPAGYIDKNETGLNAALRELREETGYYSDDITLLDSFYQDEGISAAYNQIYLARNAIKKFDQDLDKDEIIKYMTFTYEELLELENLGYINGCNAKIALSKIKK